MFKKMFYVMGIIIFCAVAFSGYLHEQDINDLAYVIAVGFDVGNDDKLKLTFQISIPSGNSSGSSGGGGSSSSEKGVSDTLNQTVECNSFNSGLNTANNIISKRLNLSHCKFIIFSEELASLGILDYIYTLENNIELRSNCNILVSTSTAEEFINSSTPILEHSTSKYYEIITTSSKYSGYTSNATLNSVYTSIVDDFSETSTMLGNVQKEEESSKDESSSSEESSSGEGGSSDGENSSGGNSSSSGQTSSKDGMASDIIIGGMAVFKKDKLVGTLSKEETVPYLIVTDKLKECVVSIPSPFSEGNYIDLHIYDFSKTKNSVKLDSSGPQITTNVTLKSTILSNDFDFDSSSNEDIEKIISAASDYFKEQITNYYEKTAREFKSDITGLGKHAVYKFPTIDDWEEYNWSEKFETATFDVNVQVNIESSYFIS
ncbi:MAG: Ger(x)C family spore germination protein [Clostridia bacterium]|nr:Ger(x)C family spore germination protein [Clostridia bacterium]